MEIVYDGQIEVVHMRHIYEAGFREIYHRVIYIGLDDMSPIAEAVDVIDGASGVIVYGFQEERATMTFMVLASARVMPGNGACADEEGCESYHVEIGPDVSNQYCRFRYGDVEESEFIPEDELSVDISAYDDIRNQVRELFEPQDETRLDFLDMEMIDQSRNPEYPEFVSLTLYDGKLSPEMVWVRPVRVGDKGEFYGHIAHDTRQKFGISTDDEIMFRAYDNGNGGIQLMWYGEN